jgi:stringent starvation protein B
MTTPAHAGVFCLASLGPARENARMSLTSNKPYLIRALYEWLLDNNATPYLLVDTRHREVSIPPNIDKDGRVVLNISPGAIQGLEMDNDHIAFSARFGGRAFDIYLPMASILAIYSADDNEGMMFAEEPVAEDGGIGDDDPTQPGGNDGSGKRPGLRVVK